MLRVFPRPPAHRFPLDPTIGVYSTAGGISKLWIEVDDPDEVLKVLKVLKNSKIR